MYEAPRLFYVSISRNHPHPNMNQIQRKPHCNTFWLFLQVQICHRLRNITFSNPISDIATVGVYYWAKGSDYVKYAEQMIDKNIRVNNEFYVCPVFNFPSSKKNYFQHSLTYYLKVSYNQTVCSESFNSKIQLVQVPIHFYE